MIRVTHSSKLTALVVVAFAKKDNRHLSKKDRAASRSAYLLVSILVFVGDSYLFCDSCIC